LILRNLEAVYQKQVGERVNRVLHTVSGLDQPHPPG
jgi:hypothetical protein